MLAGLARAGRLRVRTGGALLAVGTQVLPTHGVEEAQPLALQAQLSPSSRRLQCASTAPGSAVFDQVAKLVEPARVLATVGIVVGIAVTLAQSVWTFAVDPAPERPATAPAIEDQPTPRADVERIAAMHLFGAPGAEQSSASDLDRTPDTRLNLVLAAVFEASDPAVSVAVIGTQGRSAEAYRVGDEIPGGARLAEVHSELVVISRGGVREALRFDDLPLTRTSDGPADIRSATRSPAPPTPSTETASGPPAVPRDTANVRSAVDAYRDRLRDHPEQALSDLGLQPVSPSRTQGYRVGSLANAPQLAHTGLQAGDVIVSVNGRPVGDVRRDRMEIDTVLAEGAARLEVQRGERRFFVQASLR